MLKRGPQIKLSDLKVPQFLVDLYWDLRDRHLLPAVAVLAVAIVAVPVALSGSSGANGSGASGGAPGSMATSSSGSGSGAALVARAAPGLRDYRRRLHDLHAQNPFQQPHADPVEAGAEASASTPASPASAGSGGGGGEPSTSPGTVPAPSAPPGGAPSPPAPTTGAATSPASGGEGGTTTKVTQAKYASDTIDVRIVHVDPASDRTASSGAEPTVRRDVPELTMLPDRDTPVAVFMGTSSDGKKALLLISSDVQSLFGDGRCVVGSKVCQLLALETGLPETFVYGPQRHTYRIEILDIHRTLSDEPHRAALGEAPKNQP
jgi:hypothetical protein